MVEALVGVGGDIIVVYVDDVFVRLVLDGLVHYYYTLIASSNFSFISNRFFLLQTFFISDSNAKQQDSSSAKPARACDACYDTVFPVIHSGGEVVTNNNDEYKSDTIPSLSHLPSWLSMPSLPVPRQPDDVGSETEERERKGRVRIKSHQRSKRLSLPVIGLQTTVVTARTSIGSEEAVIVPVTTTGSEESEGVVVAVGEGGNTGLLKRYSLVLEGRSSHQDDGAAGSKDRHEHGGQAKGLAAARLSELLATKTSS